MDGWRIAVLIKCIRALFGLSLITYFGDWLGVNAFLSFGNQFVVFYFISTIIGAFYFIHFERIEGINEPFTTV
jgi:hypothetical protein